MVHMKYYFELYILKDQLTQQYFGQVEKDLRDAIFANVFNYYTFKVSEEDARALEGNLNIELPKAIIENEKSKGVSEAEIKVRMMTELHPRECLVRLLSNGQIVPALKVRTMDMLTETAQSHQELKRVKQALPEKFVERKGAAIARPSIGGHTYASGKKIDPTEEVAEQTWRTAARFNVRDLLAMHSSSRSKVKKKGS